MKKAKQTPRLTINDLKQGMYRSYGFHKIMEDVQVEEVTEDREYIIKTVQQERIEILEDDKGVFKMRNITPRMSVQYNNILKKIAKDEGVVDADMFLELWNSVYCGTEKNIPFELAELILGHHYSKYSSITSMDRFFLT